VSGTLQTVHVRVNDAATGQPTPVRVRFTDAEGNHYAPFGRLIHFSTATNQAVGGNVMIGVKPHAYIDGTCEVALPPGLLRVEIDKGPEYQPIRTEIKLSAGKLALRFEIARWIDLRSLGWYSGDTRVHFIDPHAALLEAQGEDVAVVNLLVKETEVPGPFHNTFAALPNILAFSGQQFALSAAGCGVAVNTLNSHPQLGSLGLLHCHRAVYPLSFGGPKGKEHWTLADWCDQCHRKKGLVVWTGPKETAGQMSCGEPLADLILGKVDAFEIDFWEDSPFDLLADYYTLLDAGLSVPLVGASGKQSNGTVLGIMRTYAHLHEEFSYKAWIEAVRAGRTFITNGPLLFLTVNGQEPSAAGLEVHAGDKVQIRVDAQSRSAFEELELVCNGEVIATARPESETLCRAVLEVEHPITHGGWLAARCRGSLLVLDRPANQRIFAHTSPCYLRCPEAPAQPKVDAVQHLLEELDAMLQWVATKARCDTPEQRERLDAIFRTAQAALQHGERGA
jgi:hypothetical protein